MAPSCDRPHDPFDGHRALARPGPAEHAHDGAVGADRDPLGRVEGGRRRRGGDGAAEDEHPGIPPRRPDTVGDGRQ